MKDSNKLQIDYRIFDNLSIPPLPGALTRGAIMGRFLWALRKKLDRVFPTPTARHLERRWGINYSEAHAWKTAMGGTKPKALSLPGADTLAGVCMREHINADWVLTSRGHPFYADLIRPGGDAPPTGAPGEGSPVPPIDPAEAVEAVEQAKALEKAPRGRTSPPHGKRRPKAG